MAGRTIAILGDLADERWGMFTTAQAERAGVSRKTLSGLSSSGAIRRVAQGVYRMAGSPEPDLEYICTPWLALGGATLAPAPSGAPAVVVAGESAAIAHGIGDFFPGVIDIMTPSRRTTRLADVRLRTRDLRPHDVTFIDGLPTLTVERMIADLLEQWTDRSLVVDALRQAGEQGKLLSPRELASLLNPVATAHGATSGAECAEMLLQEAGLPSEVAVYDGGTATAVGGAPLGQHVGGRPRGQSR